MYITCKKVSRMTESWAKPLCLTAGGVVRQLEPGEL